MKIEISTATGWLVIDNNYTLNKNYINVGIVKPSSGSISEKKDENSMYLQTVPLDELMKALELLKELQSKKEL